MYEELMSMEEIRRSWELDQYFVTLPAFTALYRNIDYGYPDIRSKNVHIPYVSSNSKVMDRSEISVFLKKNGLLYEDPNICRHPDERFWPDPMLPKMN